MTPSLTRIRSSWSPRATGRPTSSRSIGTRSTRRSTRILYTSAHGTGFDTPYPPLAVHAAAEAHLAASGVAWTALRNGFYGDLGQLLGPWQETGVISMPADGPFSWVDRRDAAEAAAAILTSDAPPEGPVDLTLSNPITLADFASAASALTGRRIRRIVVGDEEWITGEKDRSRARP